MAFSPSSEFDISTKPKPRERPVSRSVRMLTRSTWPYASNNWRNSSSEVLKLRLPTKMFFKEPLFLSLRTGRTLQQTESSFTGTLKRAESIANPETSASRECIRPKAPSSACRLRFLRDNIDSEDKNGVLRVLGTRPSVLSTQLVSCMAGLRGRGFLALVHFPVAVGVVSEFEQAILGIVPLAASRADQVPAPVRAASVVIV